jgi:rhomboid family GlyGly-CTERM serine protease
VARRLRLSAWTGLCALFASGALLTRPLPSDWLDWQPMLFDAAPWRAFSAVFVHWSVLHLLANLAGVAVLAWLGHAARLPRRCAVAWALAWPATQLGLLLQPALAHFGGLSGLLHAGVAVGVVELLVTRRGRERLIGAALGAGLALKLTLEQPLSAPVLRRVDGWDIAVVPFSHLSGALAGTLCALLLLLLGRRRA